MIKQLIICDVCGKDLGGCRVSSLRLDMPSYGKGDDTLKLVNNGVAYSELCRDCADSLRESIEMCEAFRKAVTHPGGQNG
jgi:hypothetical protein